MSKNQKQNITNMDDSVPSRKVYSQKNKVKKFLTNEQKNEIYQMVMAGKYPTEISKKLDISYRKVRSYIKEITHGQTNTFTKEDDDLIIRLYKSGVTKESLIAKHMQNKASWMIRNRIKKLKRKLILDDISTDSKQQSTDCYVEDSVPSVESSEQIIIEKNEISNEISSQTINCNLEYGCFDVFFSNYEDENDDCDFYINNEELIF